jgi:hypothetical protein
MHRPKTAGSGSDHARHIPRQDGDVPDIVRLMSLWYWLLLGAGTWILAVVLKVTADLYVQRTNLPDLRDWAAALLSGIWSSLCELGLFVLAIWLWNAGLVETLVAALGAALAELVALLPAILSARFGKAAGQARKIPAWRVIALERGLHVANHLFVRTLLWIGIMGTAGPAAVATAFGLFALAETAQAYAQARNWDLLQPRAQTAFLSFLGTVILLQAGLVILWW